MRFITSFILSGFLLLVNCHSQQDSQLENRKPAVAGAFYDANPDALRSSLEQLFASAEPRHIDGVVRAIIAPHAGYPYSGEVAASSYNQLDPNHKYKRIFILGSSHRANFPGASVYAAGNYETPLGEVKVDTRLAEQLVEKNRIITFHRSAHTQEHSLEVQLPFIQYRFGSDYKIVPILLGTHSTDECLDIATVLMPYFNDDNLFVVSADFSHYPAYEEACRIDKQTAQAIQSNSVTQFAEMVNSNMDENIPNLATCLCAWPAVMTLLFMTQEDPDINIRLVQYQNSGDSEIGDKSRVVGYHAISFSKMESTSGQADESTLMGKIEFELTEQDKSDLLKIARETLSDYLVVGSVPEIDRAQLSATLKTPSGAFVTLNKEGKLRGCIGRFNPDIPLYRVVQDMAISAATKDHRFNQVTALELDDIEIEISVLSPLKKINDIEEIELGKHGIYISKGLRSGTYLPQVASKTDWSLEEFVGHCSRDKAGLGWDGWKDADLYTYEAFIFEETHDK